MHKVTAKRQVTLPQTVCQAMNLIPGDYVEVFERDGVAHIVKMTTENLAGDFKDLLKDKTFACFGKQDHNSSPAGFQSHHWRP